MIATALVTATLCSAAPDAGMARLVVEFPDVNGVGWVLIDGSRVGSLPKSPVRHTEPQSFELAPGTYLVEAGVWSLDERSGWPIMEGGQFGIAEWLDLSAAEHRLRVDPPFIRVRGVVRSGGRPVRGATVTAEDDDVALCHGFAAWCQPAQKSTTTTTTVDGGVFELSLQGSPPFRIFAYEPDSGTFLGGFDGGARALILELSPGVGISARGLGTNRTATLFATDGGFERYLLRASIIDGGAVFENVRGHLRIRAGLGVADVFCADAGVSVQLADDPRYGYVTGRIVFEGNPPRGLKDNGICAVDPATRLESCGGFNEAGRFRIPVELGKSYALRVSFSRHELKQSAMARAGAELDLRAIPWRPRTISLEAADGGAVGALERPLMVGYLEGGALHYDRDPLFGETIALRGFVPFEVHHEDLSKVTSTIRLAPLPLTGTVHDRKGRPLGGVAIALLCRGDSPQTANPKWQNVLSDRSPQWSAVYWPQGVRCVTQVTQSDSAGTFSFPQVLAPVVAVEAHKGDRVQRIDYLPGAKLDFLLGD